MREQRLEQRYKGAQTHCVAIEGNTWRIIGHTSDLSRRGIGFRPSQIFGAPHTAGRSLIAAYGPYIETILKIAGAIAILALIALLAHGKRAPTPRRGEDVPTLEEFE